MSQKELNHFVGLLKEFFKNTKKPVELHAPSFLGNEKQYLNECIESGWVSSVGSFVSQFESKLQETTGAKYAVATMNGTAALHIAFLLAGVEINDEVLLPALTFVGTANAVTYCGAIPHFIDVESSSLGVDSAKLSDYLQDIVEKKGVDCINRFTGRRIKAVCVVHVLGHPADMDSLLEVCNRYGLPIIEDAAEALGSYYKGEHVGLKGLIGTLSFNGNKIITTGGGGSIITNDSELAVKAKHITTTARLKHDWNFSHDELAYNYRLPNINAALGCAQLERLNHFLQKKRLLAEAYGKLLLDNEKVSFINEPYYAKSNYWLNAVMLKEKDIGFRDELLAITNQNEILTRPLWVLMNQLPMYQNNPSMPLDVSVDLFNRVICLPSSSFLDVVLI